MADEIKCARCGKSGAGSGTRPSRTRRGSASARRFAQPAGRSGCKRQNMIINHYGLDLMNEDAQNFLFDNMKAFFFGGGDRADRPDRHVEGRHHQVVESEAGVGSRVS